ncbi:MAG: WYL domain-containing protein [Clostridiales bacterium]|nr:WYL domain-containing protein [Clostridiales bacterium]
MYTKQPKKMLIINILDILKKYTDENHRLSQNDIVEILYKEYDMKTDRKSVKRNLMNLVEFGYDIEYSESLRMIKNKDGEDEESYILSDFYLNHEFTDSELRVLIDGVLASKHISEKYTTDLIKKLCGLSNDYFRSHVKHVYSVNDWNKTENQSLFYNIELVDEAIEQNKQLRFDYNKYGADKKLHKTHTHLVSPYQLILHNQRYYLMAFNERWGDMTYYRLDRVTNMTLTDDNLTPVTSVKGYESGIDYKELAASLPYMYSDKPQTVEFIADESIIDQIIDWFGKDIRIAKHGEDQLKVTVKVSPMAMEFWAMQYAGHVTVTAPEGLKERIKNRLVEAVEKYDV